jgi:hypothetical protein
MEKLATAIARSESRRDSSLAGLMHWRTSEGG